VVVDVQAVVPQELIDSVQKNAVSFASWDENYVWTSVYDLQGKILAISGVFLRI